MLKTAEYTETLMHVKKVIKDFSPSALFPPTMLQAEWERRHLDISDLIPYFILIGTDKTTELIQLILCQGRRFQAWEAVGKGRAKEVTGMVHMDNGNGLLGTGFEGRLAHVLPGQEIIALLVQYGRTMLDGIIRSNRENPKLRSRIEKTLFDGVFDTEALAWLNKDFAVMNARLRAMASMATAAQRFRNETFCTQTYGLIASDTSFPLRFSIDADTGKIVEQWTHPTKTIGPPEIPTHLSGKDAEAYLAVSALGRVANPVARVMAGQFS